MKRTFIFVTGILSIVLAVIAFSGTAESSESGTCCISFHAQTSGGSPISGCVIDMTCPTCMPPMQCTTDVNGNCTICDVPTGVNFSATASCADDKYSNNCASVPAVVVFVGP